MRTNTLSDNEMVNLLRVYPSGTSLHAKIRLSLVRNLQTICLTGIPEIDIALHKLAIDCLECWLSEADEYDESELFEWGYISALEAAVSQVSDSLRLKMPEREVYETACKESNYPIEIY